MRNDSVLNTGLSSALDRKLAARQAEQQRLSELKRSNLTPSAEIILDWIAKEREEVQRLDYQTLLDLDANQDIRAQIMARQLHVNFLDSLSARTRNVLRTLNKETPDAE